MDENKLACCPACGALGDWRDNSNPELCAVCGREWRYFVWHEYPSTPSELPSTPSELPTLRDRFAMAAMTGIMGIATTRTVTTTEIAEKAYWFADSMLNAREAETPNPKEGE